MRVSSFLAPWRSFEQMFEHMYFMLCVAYPNICEYSYVKISIACRCGKSWRSHCTNFSVVNFRWRKTIFSANIFFILFFAIESINLYIRYSISWQFHAATRLITIKENKIVYERFLYIRSFIPNGRQPANLLVITIIMVQSRKRAHNKKKTCESRYNLMTSTHILIMLRASERCLVMSNRISQQQNYNRGGGGGVDSMTRARYSSIIYVVC